MKKTLLAVTVALVASQAFATGGGTPTPPATVSVTGTASNTVQSSSGTSAYVLGSGSSKSMATNTQTATAYVGGSGSLNSLLSHPVGILSSYVQFR